TNARVYELKTLSEEESWELFYAFAFLECEHNRPPRDLEKIAFEIEKESKRLPLAIKIVAASLAGKTSLRDWESILRELDVQSVHNKSVKGWLLDVANIAWDAEDILQECAVESIYANDGNTQCPCVICPFNNCRLFFRYKMARRIKDIRDRMESVMKDAAELKLVADLTHSDQQASTSTSQNVKWKRSSVLERDARPVAIEPKVEEILGLIDDPEVHVIAVVGMGGVGKTFLMQNVFNRIKH
ncbi:hypothetical protein KI387_020992, partial [Taxus chinensis]